MYMPSGSCTSPVAADVSGSTCVSYCASSASDCAVCEDNTFYEGYSTNTACDSCDSGKYIVSDEASDHASADQCSSCSAGYYLKGANCEICGELRHLCWCCGTTQLTRLSHNSNERMLKLSFS